MAIAKAFSKLNVCTLNTILTVALFTLQHLRLFVKKKKKNLCGRHVDGMSRAFPPF